MSEQTVVIGQIETVRSGSTNGHPWTIYKVTDGNGADLGSCLQDVADQAKGLMGQRALVVNDVETTTKDGKTYNNLKLRSVLPAPPEANGNGDVDWDAKELRGHIRACYAIASSAHGSDWPAVQKMAETILARVYDPSTPDKPTSTYIPAGTPAVGASPGGDEDIPFAASWA